MLCNVGLVFYELRRRPRRRPGRRLRGRVGDAPRRAAVVGPLPAGRDGTLLPGVRLAPPFGHASGFAAVYVAALVLGNEELPHRAATRSFAEGVAWLAQIGLFVMLGLLLSPGRIDLKTIGYAVVAGLVLTLVARPISVAGQRGRPADAVARAVVHLVGRAARRRTDRARDHPARRGGPRLRAALRHRLRAGRDLHAGHRPDPAAGRQGAEGDPALRAAGPRHRGGAARARGRRPAPGHDQPGLEDARRRGR